MFHKLHVLGMNGDLWDKVHGLGSYEYHLTGKSRYSI